MRRRHLVGLFGAALGLTGCGTNYSWNQKLIVTVSTPTGDKTGSAVTRVSANVGRVWLSGDIVSRSYQGEATVVEVAPGRYLFALFSTGGTNNTVELVSHLWPFQSPAGMDSVDALNAALSRIESLNETKNLSPEQYPLLVTFTDINDPKSVKEVKPGKLSEVFGGVYGLQLISLEITQEPATKGEIKKILPWINEFDNKYFSGSQLNHLNSSNISDSIGAGSFTTETK